LPSNWPKRFWRKLVAPISERHGDLIATVGLLVFGATGFIDLGVAGRFGYVKAIALALGLFSLWHIVKRRVRNQRD
jgi:hypothetical protein